MGEKRENELIGQFILFYWIVYKNKNWDVSCIVRCVDKIDKIVFKDIKYAFFFYIPIANDRQKLYDFNQGRFPPGHENI